MVLFERATMVFVQVAEYHGRGEAGSPDIGRPLPPFGEGWGGEVREEEQKRGLR